MNHIIGGGNSRRRLMMMIQPREIQRWQRTGTNVITVRKSNVGSPWLTSSYEISFTMETSTWEATGYSYLFQMQNQDYSVTYRIEQRNSNTRIGIRPFGGVMSAIDLPLGIHTFRISQDTVWIDGTAYATGNPSDTIYERTYYFQFSTLGIFVGGITIKLNNNKTVVIKAYKVGNEIKLGYLEDGTYHWVEGDIKEA